MERNTGFGVGRWVSNAGFTMVGNWLTFWGKLYYLICEMDALIRLLSDKEWRPPLAFSVMDFYNRNSYGGKGDRNPLIKTKSKQNFMKPGTGRS